MQPTMAMDNHGALYVTDAKNVYSFGYNTQGDTVLQPMFLEQNFAQAFGIAEPWIQSIDIGPDGSLYAFEGVTSQMLSFNLATQVSSIDVLPVPLHGGGLGGFNAYGEKKYILVGADDTDAHDAIYLADGSSVSLLYGSTSFPQALLDTPWEHLAAHTDGSFLFLPGSYGGLGIYKGNVDGSPVEKVRDDLDLYDENGFVLGGAMAMSRAVAKDALVSTGTALFYVSESAVTHRLEVTPTLTEYAVSQGYKPDDVFFGGGVVTGLNEDIFVQGARGIYKLTPLAE